MTIQTRLQTWGSQLHTACRSLPANETLLRLKWSPRRWHHLWLDEACIRWFNQYRDMPVQRALHRDRAGVQALAGRKADQQPLSNLEG